MSSQPPTSEELSAARQYLRGTFPLRFGSASPVAGAVAGLVAVGLEPSELDRFQTAIDAVSGDDVANVAAALDREAERIVVVGDAATVAAPLRDAGFSVEIRGDGATQ
jgi:zinc protease